MYIYDVYIYIYNIGARPSDGYNPMHKQGAIILGIGGDNSDRAVGTFYEGCMVSGYTNDDTDDKVQANIAAVGYAINKINEYSQKDSSEEVAMK